jgi:rare lipoprotein A (peptidoglycan hydrolase)
VNRLLIVALLGMLILTTAGCSPRGGTVVCSLPKDESPTKTTETISSRPDLTGHTRIGKASFYAASFYHRVMADGNRMNPRGYNAASKTLPLGTTAKVTNLATGQSAIVQIQDRGPYVKGRIVDLSPAIASKIGITRRLGVAPVKVAPIMVPQPDGTTKFGSGLVRPVCRVT